MKHNSVTYTGKILTIILWDFLYFPLWWYSAGLVKTARGVLNFYKNQEAALGFLVWLKNILVPMYGQRDLAGRLVSFFVRLVQVIYRGLVMLVVIFLGLVFFIFYLILPPLILLAVYKQLF
ncbi:MAG: hypothetical protein WCK59_01665 [Candidatus Falkowbacteria bacterium]